MKKPTAREVMIREVICVPAEMDIRELETLFLEKKISGAPVVDGKGALLGVISQKDLVNYHLREEDHLRWESDFYQRPRLEGRPLPRGFAVVDPRNSPRVEEVMTPTAITAPPDAPVSRLASMMNDKRVHRIIITEEGRVVGIVSALDLLSLLREDSRT